jgi:hypothetical protein
VEILSTADCGYYSLYLGLFMFMDGKSLDSGRDTRPHGGGDPVVDILLELERNHGNTVSTTIFPI